MAYVIRCYHIGRPPLYYKETCDGSPVYRQRKGSAAILNEAVAKKVAEQLQQLTAHPHTALRLMEAR